MDGHGKAPLEYPCKGAEKGDQMDTDCRHAAQLCSECQSFCQMHGIIQKELEVGQDAVCAQCALEKFECKIVQRQRVYY